MNANRSIEPKNSSSIPIKKMDWQPWLRLFLFFLLIPGILFLSAGTANWLMGWLYTIMLVAIASASWIVMLRTSPELLVERSQFLKAQGVKNWDKIIAPLVALGGPLAIWIVAGLDLRYTWSPKLSVAWQLLALAITTLGYSIIIWAVGINKFFSSVVRIQKERGHTVVTKGPYQLVRHPGYVGAILAYLATPIALGSLWAIIPSGLTILLLIVRTALEDRTLQQELEGYKEYAQQVRYRLIVGLW